jgi:AbrB family looped-hinge helix DNA binding protein
MNTMTTTGERTEAAQLRARGQLTVPGAIREALHAREGDYLEFTVDEFGVVTVRATRRIAADQAWFWTPEWQAGEREADADYAAGQTLVFDSGAEFIADLEAASAEPDAASPSGPDHRPGRTRAVRATSR